MCRFGISQIARVTRGTAVCTAWRCSGFHILLDTLGLLSNVVVHPADVQDRDGAFLLLRRARRLFPFIKRIFADGGHAGGRWRSLSGGQEHGNCGL